jgi:TonB-dependent receptor
MKQILFLFSILFTVAFATQAQSGKIIGKIIDEQGLSMPGATLKLGSSPIQMAVSDQSGRFSFSSVKNGKYELTVTYIGYQPVKSDVEINDQTLQLTLKMVEAAINGTEVIVVGDRLKGQAKALNQQRNNSNITNVVSADQIGRFPDANIGDAIKRIPGITMQNDQGEARNIIIRGMAAGLNSVTLNGERIPSAEGDNRNIQMDLIPADMIQTVEVNKAILPNMDADAIGGSVNLVTRTAPNDLRVSGTLGSGVNFLSDKPITNIALVLGNRILNEKLGIVLSGSFNNHIFGSDNFEGVWSKTKNAAYPVVLSSFDLRKYDVQRIRRSGSLALDYQLAKGHTIFLNAMYNWRDDRENRYRFRVDRLNTPVEAATFKDISKNLYEIRGRVAIQTKGGIENDRNKGARLEDQRVANVSLSGEDIFGKLKMNWSGTYAYAQEDRPNERYITHRGNANVRVNTQDPSKYVVNFIDEKSSSALALNEIYESNNFTTESDINAKIDFEIPLANKNNLINFGGRLRNKNKERINSYDIYSPIGNIGTGGNTFGALPSSPQNDRIFLNGAQYVPGNFIDKSFLGNLDIYNSSVFKKEDAIAEYITTNYDAAETISAGYAMTKLKLTDKFSGILGLRLENTSIVYNGYSFDEDEEKASPISDVKKSYLNVLPGIHLKYDLGSDAILRAAWTNSIARPSYFSLVPYESYSPDNQTLLRGNPNLEATKSMNFDLMAENYFESIGLVSAGFFQKTLKDFIYDKTTLNVVDPKYGQLISSTRPENGGTANAYGIETALQRQLDFLPGIWKGLGIYLNYTFTNTTTSGIEGRENDELALPGTAKHMFNSSLSFENKKLVLRVSLNRSSDYLDAVGGDTFTDIFYDKQLFLDVNASYAFNKNLRVYFEANNLTNQPLRYYQGSKERTIQEEMYNSRIGFGLKYDLFGKK